MNSSQLNNWIKESCFDKEIHKVSSLYKGVINNTDLITFSNKDKAVLKYCNNYDVGSVIKLRWQYDVQSDLKNLFPVPKVFKYCSDRSVIGQPFYIMEYIDGESKYDFDSVKESFNLLSDLHKLNLVDIFGKKYKKDVKTENILEKIYKQYKITEINRNPDVDYIFSWLKNNVPKERITSFCHNDWRMSNVIFSNNENTVLAIDWELSDFGDPRADLGIALAYWPEKSEINAEAISPEPPFKFNHVDKDYFAKMYFEKSGFDFLDWNFFEVFGLFRLISIAQLGAYRKSAGIIDNMVYNDIDKKTELILNKCKRIIGDTCG